MHANLEVTVEDSKIDVEQLLRGLKLWVVEKKFTKQGGHFMEVVVSSHLSAEQVFADIMKGERSKVKDYIGYESYATGGFDADDLGDKKVVVWRVDRRDVSVL
jgi:hypothetical protein